MKNAPHILDRRLVSAGYGVFALALLVQELVSAPTGSVARPTLALLGVLSVGSALMGALITASAHWQRVYALLLLALNAALALSIVAVSGGYASPLWPVVLIPMSAALLLLP